MNILDWLQTNDAKHAIKYIILGFVLMLVLGWAVAAEACRDDGWLPSGGVAYVGLAIDFPVETSDSGNPYCHDDSNETGVFGLRIPAYRHGRHTLALNAEHNSCFQEEHDLASDDRLEIRYEFMGY